MHTYESFPKKTVKPAVLPDSVQRKQIAAGGSFQPARNAADVPVAENRTGLPDLLKARIENLSGISLDDVKVHYNSPRPSMLRAFAYTQGTDIHVAPGEEKHLPHEAWHVIQQKQGRVRPTGFYGGMGVNDDERLEREADLMGRKSMTTPYAGGVHSAELRSFAVQCASDWKTPTLEEQTKDINPKNPDLLQRVIHHMLPRKLLEDFCACLTADQQERLKQEFAANKTDIRSNSHRILKSLHSNLIVGPGVSSRLDDEDHLKGERGGQQYFFDATGGRYTAVSEIYRGIFPKAESVVRDGQCIENKFGEIVQMLKQAEEAYREISGRESKDDFSAETLVEESGEIWREIKVNNKSFFVKRSGEYIITVKKELPYYMNAVREIMQSRSFETSCDYEKNILTCTKRTRDDQLDQDMERLNGMLDKGDALSVRGIFP